MLATKIGRNDTCPCGSGKKYKKCCMVAESMSTAKLTSIDFKWRQLRQLENSVVYQHILPYVTNELPDDIMKSALVDCFSESLPDELDEELLCDHYFLPWFLFNWIPDDTFGLKQFNSELTVAQNYLKTHSNRLNSQEKRFIELMSQSYYSFYSIRHVELETSLTVKDILLGTTHTIKERLGTHQLKPGDIVFGRILTIDDHSIFIGMAPFVIPVLYQSDFLNYRDWLIEFNGDIDLNTDTLRFDFDGMIRDHYFEVLKMMYDRPSPIVQNTDGEPIQFSKSYFKLNIAPEEAFNHLKPLTLEEDPDDFLQEAKKDKSGALKEIQFPWIKKGTTLHKSWDNTILGHITLEHGQLILETNSYERAQQGKKVLSQYLGDAVMFQKSLIETPEQKIKNSSKPNTKSIKNKADGDLMELPEVQEQLKAMAEKHWKNWFDQSIPDLKNKTPREAVKTKDGRERLEALLLYYQHNDSEKSNNPFKADIPYLKKELGLESDHDR